jgi:hypothetical protein
MPLVNLKPQWFPHPFWFLCFFFKPVLQTYHPHSRACNPYSPSFIFGGPNTLLSSISRSNAHNSISDAIAHSSVSFIVPSRMFPGILCTLPPFVSFFIFFYFALCYRIVCRCLPLHVAMVQKTMKNSCVDKRVLICNILIISKRW